MDLNRIRKGNSHDDEFVLDENKIKIGSCNDICNQITQTSTSVFVLHFDFSLSPFLGNVGSCVSYFKESIRLKLRYRLATARVGREGECVGV